MSVEKTNFQLAEEHHDESGKNFVLAMEEHHNACNGWVIDVPYSFGMGYFYEDEGEVILYVSYVNGDMGSLLGYCLNIKIDKIEFMRNFTSDVRRYSFDRFLKRCK